MSKTLAEDIERSKDGKKLIADEKGNLHRKKDLTRSERGRITINKWWVIIGIIVAASQVTQAIFSFLNYCKCR